MSDKKVRVGDIIRDESVSDKNPFRYAMATMIGNQMVRCAYVRKDGEIAYTDYYKYDVEKREDLFKIVGNVDLNAFLRKSINGIAFMDREKNLMHEKAMQDIKHEELQKKKRGV